MNWSLHELYYMCAPPTSPAKSAPASWLSSSHSESSDMPRQYDATARVKS